MEDKERVREMANRDRENRSRRGDKPSRFSDGGRERERERSSDRGGERGRKSSTNRVYVSNISYEYRWQDLKDLFRSQVGEVAFVELFVDENDKPKGCGIVEFSEPASVKKCMEVMHRFDLKGRKLVIKEDFGNERDKHGNIINGRRNRDRDNKDWDDMRERRDRRGGGGGGNNWGDAGGPPSLLSNMFNTCNMPDPNDTKWGPTWGLSPQFLESLGINRPLVNRVFVANLDYKVDEKKLQEVFKLAGKVTDVELYRDKEGNSRGFAVIDYDHPVESVQAISMFHNQMLYDRPMTVRMDRIDHSEGPLRLPEGLKSVGMGLGVNGEPLRDVSRHLPSTSNNVSDINSGGGGNSGAGILGAVPNPALPNLGTAAAALSNVVNTPALAGLASASAALQGLTGVPNQFLAGNLSELGLANLNSSLVGNSLNPSALNALTGNNMGGGNMSGSNVGQGNVGMHTFNRDNQNMYHGPGGGNREYTSAANRDFDNSSARSNYDIKSEGEYRDDFNNRPAGGALYSTVNNGSQRRDNSQSRQEEPRKFISDTVVVNNLPSTMSWKMLRDKFSSCGDIQFVEMKSKETALVRFANDWEADRAIQLLDRTRMDGRTIEVRFF